MTAWTKEVVRFGPRDLVAFSRGYFDALGKGQLAEFLAQHEDMDEQALSPGSAGPAGPAPPHTTTATTATAANRSAFSTTLADFHASMKTRRFAEEFSAMHDLCQQELPAIYQVPKSSKLDRYTDIQPFAGTRVELAGLDGDPLSTYINASHINTGPGSGVYIAAQAPTLAAYVSFWRMIAEQRVELLVMLTPLKEVDTTGAKVTKADMYMRI